MFVKTVKIINYSIFSIGILGGVDYFVGLK